MAAMDSTRPAARGAAWQRVAARLSWPVLLVVVAIWVASRILVPPPPGTEWLDPLPWHVAMTAYGVIGAIIVNRRPGNLVGWLFLVVGLFDPMSAAVRAIAIADVGGVPLAGADLAAWLQAWIWAPSLGALSMLVWVFPTGRPLPGIWTWGSRVTLFGLAVLLIPTPIALWPLRSSGLLLGEETLPGAAGVVSNVGFFTLMLSAAWGVTSLAVRLRRSRGEERQQIKWVVFAALLLIAQAFVDIVVLDGLNVGDSMARETLSAAVITTLPITAAIALLKYRLYDIDRLLNRTVVYGALTAGCAGAYLAVVALVRLFTQPLTGDTNIAVAASTLVVAALFRPARRRVQDAVDRRFNRARYDAARTVAQFSGRLRDEVELEILSAELLAVVDRTVHPSTRALWLNQSPG